jgi:hypothetical protein
MPIDHIRQESRRNPTTDTRPHPGQEQQIAGLIGRRQRRRSGLNHPGIGDGLNFGQANFGNLTLEAVVVFLGQLELLFEVGFLLEESGQGLAAIGVARSPRLEGGQLLFESILAHLQLGRIGDQLLLQGTDLAVGQR